MEKDFAPIPLNQNQPNPEIKPVQYKPLAEEPEKRKEQIEKLTNSIGQIKEKLDKRVPYSEYKESYNKLNYYLSHLSPKDRFDVLKSLSENNLVDTNTFFYLFGENYSHDLDSSKFPKRESRVVFLGDNFDEIIEIFNKAELFNYPIDPSMFDKLNSEEARNYFLSKNPGNNILKSKEYFGLTPSEAFKKYFETIKPTNYSYNDENIVKLTIATNVINEVLRDLESETSRDSNKDFSYPEMKKMLNLVLEDYKSLLNKYEERIPLGIENFDSGILSSFSIVVQDYEKFGYDYDELMNELVSTFGVNHASYLLPKFKKEERSKVFKDCLNKYENIISDSTQNRPRNLYLNYNETLIENPIQALFSRDLANIEDYDINQVIEFLSKNNTEFPGMDYFKFAVSSGELDKYLEYIQKEDPIYGELNKIRTYFRLIDIKNDKLSLEEKRVLAQKLNNNFEVDFTLLGYSTDEILDLIELSNKKVLLREVFSRNKASFSPEQLIRIRDIALKRGEYDAYFEIICNSKIEVSSSDIEQTKSLLIKLVKANPYFLTTVINSQNPNFSSIVNFDLIEEVAQNTNILDIDLFVFDIISNQERIKNFDKDKFIKLVLSNGSIRIAYDLFSQGIENPIEKFKVFIVENSKIISVKNIETIFLNPELTDEERMQILKIHSFPSAIIFNYMINNYDKGKIPSELYKSYLESIVNDTNNQSEANKTLMAGKMSEAITNLYNNPDSFKDPVFKDILKFYSEFIKTDLKISDYLDEDIVARIRLYTGLPSKFISGLNLNFNQRLLEAVSKIPSSLLLEKSIKIFVNSLPTVDRETGEIKDPNDLYLLENIENTYNNYGKNIPLNIFSQIYLTSSGNTELISKYNEIYSQKIGKQISDNISYLIISSSEINNPTIKEILNSNITKLDFKDKDKVSEELKTLRLLLVIDSLGDLSEDESKIFTENFSEFTSDYNDKCKTYILENLNKIFPNIPQEVMLNVLEFYPDIEPFLTYTKGLKANVEKGAHGSEILDYLDEIIKNLGPGDTQKWKQWRYDKQNPAVAKQLQGLTDPEIESWKQDRIINLDTYYAEIGLYDSFIKESKDEIIKFLSQIVDSSENLKTNPYINSLLKQILTFERNNYNQDSFNELINKILDSINDVVKNTRIIQGYQNVEKIGTYLNSLVSNKENLALTANELERIEKFFDKILTKDDIEEIRNNFELEKQNSTRKNSSGITVTNLDKILSTSLQSKISKYLSLAENKFNQARATIEGLGISTDTQNIRSLGKDLDFVIDLCNLLTINTDEIRSQRFKRDNSSKDLSTTISNVANYYKTDSSGDLKLALNDLLSRADVGPSNTEVAVIITDNPYLLLNVGKYPLGNGSCQNYENPSLNKTLLGYVGDAGTKAIFVIQVNKLSEDLQQKIKEGGIESLINTPYETEILPAIIGRSVLKLGTAVELDEDNNNQEFPGLYIEPTYTLVNKSNRSLNPIIYDAVISGYAKDMGLGVYTGVGSTTIKMNKSRNPEGQYEDGSLGGAHHGGMGQQQDDYELMGERIY